MPIREMSSIKIAYLVSKYPSITHTFILDEILALKEKGVLVEVVSIQQPDKATDSMLEAEALESSSTFYVQGARVTYLVWAHLLTIFTRPTYYFRGLCHALGSGAWHPRRTLFSLFYFVESVVVGNWMMQKGHVHFHSHFSSTVGHFVQMVFPISMSMTIHGPAEFDDVVGFKLEDKVKASLFVRAISSYSRSQMMKISPSKDWRKIVVVPMGVDPGAFRRAEPYSPGEKVVLLFVGRMVAVKAPSLLLEVVHELRCEGLPLELRFAGDGPERIDLENEAALKGLCNVVYFDGWIDKVATVDLMAKADIFVLPSFAEGVPVVLMEAMAMELPCVTTWVAGIPELVRNGVDGLLVPPGTKDELKAAIRTLAKDAALRARYGVEGRKRVIEKYNVFTNASTLADTFRSYLSKV